MTKYKVTLKQQLLVLSSFLIIDGGAAIIYLYFFGVHIPYTIFMLPLLLVFVLTILPVLILHIQYYRANKSSELMIDKRNRKLRYITDLVDLEVSFGDIEFLHFYGSFAGDSGLYTFSAYRYFKIILKDKQEIFITSLMMYDIKNKLPELLSMEAISHFSFLATIK